MVSLANKMWGISVKTEWNISVWLNSDYWEHFITNIHTLTAEVCAPQRSVTCVCETGKQDWCSCSFCTFNSVWKQFVRGHNMKPVKKPLSVRGSPRQRPCQPLSPLSKLTSNVSLSPLRLLLELTSNQNLNFQRSRLWRVGTHCSPLQLTHFLSLFTTAISSHSTEFSSAVGSSVSTETKKSRRCLA